MHEGVVSGIESAHIVLDGEMWYDCSSLTFSYSHQFKSLACSCCPIHHSHYSLLSPTHSLTLCLSFRCGRGFFLESQVPVQTADVGVVNWGLLRYDS